jgi:phytanoyl-CoA hydroxylase
MASPIHSAFTPDELLQFESDGYLVARGLLRRDECAAIKAIAQRDLDAIALPVEYEADTHYPGAPPSHDAPGGRTVRRLLHAYERDARLSHCATAPVIAARLGQLLGPRVELAQSHHNCVMTKTPRYSSVTGWHQDIRYWSYQRPELISVWFALGREVIENGCLLVIPGTHKMDLSAERYDAALFLRQDTEENQELISRQKPVELDAGDVLFFHCRLFHAAGKNTTSVTKFSLVYTYHAADNRPLAGTRSSLLPDVPLALGAGSK